MADFPGIDRALGLSSIQSSPAPAPGRFSPVEASQGATHDVMGQELAGPPEVSPPTISGVSPAPGTTITRGATVSFDVMDDNGLGLVEVQVDQIQREVVHDGLDFVYPYTGSVKVVYSPRHWHFQITRLGGWRVSPVFRVRALDRWLNEA